MTGQSWRCVESSRYASCGGAVRSGACGRGFLFLSNAENGNWPDARWRVRKQMAKAEWSGRCIRSEPPWRLAEILPHFRAGDVKTAAFRPGEGWRELEVRKQDDCGCSLREVSLKRLSSSPPEAHSCHRCEFPMDQTDLHALKSPIQVVLCEFPDAGAL